MITVNKPLLSLAMVAALAHDAGRSIFEPDDGYPLRVRTYRRPPGRPDIKAYRIRRRRANRLARRCRVLNARRG